MGLAQTVRDILRGEFDAADLGSLIDAKNTFLKGTAEELSAAQAIADNVTHRIQDLIDGGISKDDFAFIIEQASHGYVALAEAKVVRLKVAAIQAFFDAVLKIIPRL